MNTQNNIQEAYELLSKAIYIMVTEVKQDTLQGQWFDSILNAINLTKRAREQIEGIK